MLVAGIDRNKATEPDKPVERVLSPAAVFSIPPSEENPEFVRHLHKRRGVILRQGDRRRSDRRQNHVAARNFPPDKDRRQRPNRQEENRWNSNTHDIIVVAVEKDPNFPDRWSSGQEVFVDPGPQQQVTGSPYVPPPTYSRAGTPA
ncbi:MAG: hypothetical protein GWN72_23550, partial [Nitrospinaceae bacterium]|nr:hypothetical protein [Nitrospinaceae bacterium]NIW61711.1 hypothetical protein [Nitrospinaceae bacterium]